MNTAAGYPRDRRVEDSFAAEALRRPNQLAVAFEGQRLRYRDLHEQSDRLARRLNHLGVGPGDRVALHVRALPRHGRRIARHPQGRRRLRASRSEPPHGPARLHRRGRPAAGGGNGAEPARGAAAGSAAILCLDALSEPPACPGPAGVRRASDVATCCTRRVRPDRPKGVQIPHYALVNFLQRCTRAGDHRRLPHARGHIPVVRHRGAGATAATDGRGASDDRSRPRSPPTGSGSPR